MKDFTHIDGEGNVKMVDVSGKVNSFRTSKAAGEIILPSDVIEKIKEKKIYKGDVITTAKIAGISAAKKTYELIPLCHQIKITSINIDILTLEKENKIEITAYVSGDDKTGVEMEALIAVSVSLLTIYDMCKALTKKMQINNIRLLEKTGGKSDFQA